ncbi:hypothetical protein [Altererythrobacter sp. C41]|uniref:hypothetical protein n=1 Tax=Altererythrobacter sp. C41 TaxID=2806021 RepID=UPI0019320A67|nr:hypothetical protein [Altererythrobacter sp. C41]MBM0169392.1 hypothetical protein [Altererythrobacter sp. C41]
MAEKARRRESRRRARTGQPLLEWIAAAIGLLLTLAVLGALGWESVKGSGARPPAIEASIGAITPTPAGYVVEVELRNRSSATAAAVEVEGELTKADGTVATSTTTVDYVPGDSTRKAGLFFQDDPRRHRVDVRALGFAEP